MNFNFEVPATDAFKAALLEASSKVIHAAAQSLYESAELVMTDSKQNYVPILTGALRSSGFVQLPEIDGTDVTVTLSYGGPAVDYAVFVHENLRAHHPHGQAKYLETPLVQHMDEIANKLVADVNEATK